MTLYHKCPSGSAPLHKMAPGLKIEKPLNDISSVTTRWILMKLHRNDRWVTLYQNCPNRSAPLNKMAVRAKNRNTFKRHFPIFTFAADFLKKKMTFISHEYAWPFDPKWRHCLFQSDAAIGWRDVIWPMECDVSNSRRYNWLPNQLWRHKRIAFNNFVSKLLKYSQNKSTSRNVNFRKCEIKM